MGFGSVIARAILSIIFIVSFLAFLVLSSAAVEIKDNTLENVITEAVSNILENEIAERSNSTLEQAEDFYNQIMQECEGKESIILENSLLEIPCDEIRNADVQNAEEIIREQLREKIREEVSSQVEETPIPDYLAILDWIAIGFGIFSLIILVIIFLISVPRYTFFINLGFIGIFFFIPALVVNAVPLDDLYLDSLKNTASLILENIFFNSILVFVSGVVLLFIGLVWGHYYKKSHPKELRKKR